MALCSQFLGDLHGFCNTVGRCLDSPTATVQGCSQFGHGD